MNKSTWMMILFTWFLGNLSIHFMTPALPHLAQDFMVTPGIAKLAISLFLLGKAISMLVWSSLSEQLGRKPVFIAGIVLFACSNLLASISHSIVLFLICRCVQGWAVGATLLMGRAMINDSHNEQQATKQFAFLFTLAGLFICFLPFIGGLINSIWGWRTAALILTGYGLLLLFFVYRVEETKPLSSGQSTLQQSVSLVFRNALFVRYLLISALMMAGESLFNTSASFLLIQGADYSIREYGSIKSLMAIMHLIGTGACGLMIRYFSSARLAGFGVQLFAFSSLVMWVASLFNTDVVFTLIAPMAIYYFGTGFIVACATAASVRPFPKQMATALALTLFCQFNFSAGFSLLSSLLAIQTISSFMLLMTLISFLSLICWHGKIKLFSISIVKRDSKRRIV